MSISGGDSDDEQRSYTYRVNNGAFEPQSFRVRIGNEAEMWFHEESFELDASSGTDDVTLEGTPAELFVTVGSGEERVFPGPASMSELGTAAENTDIWYEPTQEQEILIYGDM